MQIDSIIDFLEPVNLHQISEDEGFRPTQLGSKVEIYQEYFPDLTEADVIIAGCGEYRGSGNPKPGFDAANAVRKHFYSLFHWHKNVHIADIGNIKTGNKIADSLSAVQAVLSEVSAIGKKVLLIGGSHDITQAQSNAFRDQNRLHEIVCIDAKIDLDKDTARYDESFLLQLFTQNPNFIKHYNHIGFQSYFVQADMLETIDKLRFDCFRVGRVKEQIEEVEPIFRNSHMVSVDISAFASAYAPANKLTPNGFNGEEMCSLFKYAGLSNTVETLGIYGYDYKTDRDELTAKQLSHCLWYFLDGIYKSQQEAPFNDPENYNEYHLAFSEVQTVFLQSKKTGRWWMQLPNGKYIACSYTDYHLASQDEIPERWLRAIERE